MAQTVTKIFWVATALVSAPGIVLFGMKYGMRGEDPYSAVHHPLQPWMLKLHLLAAPFFVFALGAIAVLHVWPQFVSRARSGRRSGMATVYFVLPLVVSGYLIQLLTQEGALTVTRWVHIGLGFLFVMASLAHRQAAKRYWDARERSDGAASI